MGVYALQYCGSGPLTDLQEEKLLLTMVGRIRSIQDICTLASHIRPGGDLDKAAESVAHSMSFNREEWGILLERSPKGTLLRRYVEKQVRASDQLAAD